MSTPMRAPAGRRQTALRAAKPRAAGDEKAYLYEIIQTIGSGPDLETVLRGIIRLVTEATGCHACFVYFLDGDRLVLRAASSIYAHLEGKIAFSMGEGLTGWVAKTRRSAFIRDNALEDPRVRYVPEMEEERFQSMVSVPVFSRAGAVIGVINLHTEAPREFDRGDLDFLEHTASLVAGAIENARLYEEATERVALLTELSRLSHQIALAGSVADLLATVTSGCRKLLRAERAELYLLEGDDRLVLRSASPERPGARGVPETPGARGVPETAATVLEAKHLWFEVVGLDSPAAPAETRALAETLWGATEACPLFAPLVVGKERPGLLGVLCPQASPDAHSVLSAIAFHTAVALKRHELIDKLREENLVKDFFEALSRGQESPEELAAQAARLGCDLDSPHVVLHAVAWPGPVPPPRRTRRAKGAPVIQPLSWTELLAAFESPLSGRLPGTVFDRRTASLRALVPVPPGRESEVADMVRAVHTRAVGDKRGWMTIGLSNVCREPTSFQRAFEEAASAAEVGALIKGAPGVYTYEDLGPYRYVLNSEEAFPDRYQQRLARLVEYDARRGTELLRTLEMYLEGRGNVVGTARSLHTHPNTLRQRLGRIERLCGFDFEREDWLSLGIAIKIVNLRLARRSVRAEEDERG